MNRFPFAILALIGFAAAACSHPKAIVVNEPGSPAARSKPTKSAAPSEARAAPSKPVLGLRDPDVVSELPDAGPQTPAPAGTNPAPGNPGTVIVRPPR